MSGDGLWSRIRKGRLVQVLGVYLAVSWGVLQVVAELRDALDLPGWLGPVALVLLIIGLVVILATAWVQSHPLIDAREADDAVPRSWEVDVGEMQDALRKRRFPHLTWARAALGGVFAFSLLFGIAGLYLVIQDRGESFEPAPSVAGEAAPAIAILPFAVRGPGLEIWEEGMVDALTTNLDGVAGYRTIASQTVLARWQTAVPDGASPDLPTAISVASAAGARYAVTGNVISTGTNLRLTADVHDARTGASLGHGQVEGPPDSVFALVDRLSIEVLRTLAAGEGVSAPAFDLASVTSRSLPALRAYLEGEARFRQGDVAAAIGLYERAIEADTTFAMASYRLDAAHGWATAIPRGRFGVGAIDRAMRHAGGLPQRQSDLIRARYETTNGSYDGIDLLRRLVRRHPDDAEAWYLLGDGYLHGAAGALMVDLEDVTEAFERAVENAPGFAPFRFHLFDLAGIRPPDSALAAQHLAILRELGAESPTFANRDVAFRLMFGDSLAQRAAMDEADPTVEVGSVFLTTGLWYDPHFARQREIWGRKPYAQGITATTFNVLIPTLAIARGKVAEALELTAAASVPAGTKACVLYRAQALGLPVPIERLETAFGAVDTAQVGSCSTLYRGAFAAERDRWADHAAVVSRLRRQADASRADSTLNETRRRERVRHWEAQVRALEGYEHWRRGRRSDAVSALEEARTDGDWIVRLWLADLHEELDQPEEAKRYLESLPYGTGGPIAHRLGRLSERLGETDDARWAFEGFVIAWEEADPELQPMVEEARQALARLLDTPSPEPLDTTSPGGS